MMSKWPATAWLLIPVGLAGLALLSAVAPRTAAQQATVHIEVPTGITSDSEPFTAFLIVDGVTNLGAFQFGLSYDPAILSFAEVKEGPFLGSSGRTVNCLPPRTDVGVVELACVTLGSTPEGPTGSGELATITFEPLAEGSSALHFTRLTITDPPGQALPAQTQDATVTVGDGGSADSDGGFAWALWAPIIGAVVLALAAAGGFAWWARRSR